MSSGNWLHIDVADGKFTTWKSWGNPDELKDLNTKLNIEVHLMVEDPQGSATPWLEAGARRLIVPVQKVRGMDTLQKLVNGYQAELMPSFDMSVPIEEAEKYLWAEYVGVLAVTPGQSGQVAQADAFDRIKFLRERMPGVKIEFDGGVDLDTGARALQAGADILISGHYIFESANPKENFEKLNNLKSHVS